MIVFGQQDYTGELGTGHGATIHDYGCALCSVAMLLVNSFSKTTDPNQLNQDLIRVGGYGDNGAGAVDEIVWSAINKIYSDITILYNNAYPSSPADMGIIDSQLAKGIGVVVGVSFNHDVNAKYPDHYVLLTAKNADGTYQCSDPWFKDNTNFNARYAVNGMTVANAILQAISYSGVVGGNSTGCLLTNSPQDQATFANLVHGSTQWDDAVAKYLPDNKPETAQFSDLQRVIAGFQSRITDLGNQLTDAQKATVAAQTQATNASGQIDAIKQQLVETVALYETKLKAATVAINAQAVKDQGYETHIESMQGQIDTLTKAKGQLQIDLATTQKELDIAYKQTASDLTIPQLLSLAVGKLFRKSS